MQTNTQPEFSKNQPTLNRHAEKINRVLFSLADAVNTTLNLNELYTTIHTALGNILDVTNFFIAIVDAQKRTLYFPYYVDTIDEDFSPINDFDTSSSLTGLVVLEKKPILLRHDQLKKREKKSGVWGPVPLAWMGVPLLIRDKVIGVIAVQSYIDPDIYSEEDLEILFAVSHQTAVAIDRKRSLEELHKSEERRDFALKATGSGIWDWNIETDEIYLDPNHYTMAGYEPEEYPSTTSEWKKRVHADDLPGVVDLLRQTTSGQQQQYKASYRYLKKNGDWMWILSQGKIVSWDNNNSPQRFIGTHTDITQQKQADQKLQKSEETYRNIFHNAQIGLFRMRQHDLKLTECNEAMAAMLGYADRKDCIAGFSAPDAFASHKNLREVLRQIRKDGEVKNNISQFYRKDGSLAWLRTSVKVYEKENYLEGVVEDITQFTEAEEEKKRLQEQLVRSKKMEALGLLAGSVAHDLNNILSGIVSYPELLLLKLEKDSELIQPIQAIRDSGNRAATVVNDLLTIARGAASIKEVRNLNSLIQQYVSSPECMQYKKKYPNIIIRLKLDADSCNIFCSPVHVSKSLMNLVINGIEAVNQQGTITISTTHQHSSKLHHPDKSVALVVHDDGPGIDQKDLPRIFEPFYTQKIMGKSGTGLGLTVVWNTMDDHNGEVSVTSDSSGTTFTLLFPTTSNLLSDKEETFEIDHLKGNQETILIIDDEPQLREIARQQLTLLGYTCITVESGEAAIDYLKENTVDVMLLDMLMEPGLNGRETYEEVSRFHPGQKAIIASGYSESKEVELALQKGVGEFVKKPYSLRQLGTAIKKILQA